MHAATSRQLISVRNLSVQFRGTYGIQRGSNPPVRAVDGISFEITRSSTFGLVGESGCGKSTTARAIVRLIAATAGTIEFDGSDISRLRGEALRGFRRRTQMVFQSPLASFDPRMSLGRSMLEPLQAHAIGSSTQRQRRVAELLDSVGLNARFARRYPRECSGGQLQRVAIARALAVDPEFVVLDEPVSSLDVSIQGQILNLLIDLRERLELTYLMIAHDLSVVRLFCTSVAVMYLGKLVEFGPSNVVLGQPSHPYTLALLAAVPSVRRNGDEVRSRLMISGEMPSPSAPPTGCRFHTRCWLYERLGRPEVCRDIEPGLSPLEAAHSAACHFADEAVKAIDGL
jgi:oligopeptide/dipeptide ABC transporter ATP-binding protein